jgi:catechol 2,3-dioxygenase-like lactoylglutathione lyase family enzyme
MPSVPITRLNHAVLYVSDLNRSADFYRQAFGFEEIGREGPMAFFRAAGCANHHDLALLGVGPNASPTTARRGRPLPLAWEVPAIEDLAAAAATLTELNALHERSRRHQVPLRQRPRRNRVRGHVARPS